MLPFRNSDPTNKLFLMLGMIYRMMHELPWITFFFWWRVRRFAFNFHEWVTSENHWQIAPRVTQKSLFTVTIVLSYFLYVMLCPEHTIPLKNNNRLLISPLLLRTAFSDLALRRHLNWSVTSRERGVLALRRHIHQLFLQAQIGAMAIFTSE